MLTTGVGRFDFWNTFLSALNPSPLVPSSQTLNSVIAQKNNFKTP